MKIRGRNISLVQTKITDEDLDNLIDDVEELFNMSETRLYPDELPLEMRFRIEQSGKLIGELKLSRIRWYNRKAELGIIIKKENHSKGLGSEAVGLILEYAFNKMNMHRIEAEVIENNTASIKLIEKFGFVKEGTLREAKYAGGKYLDVYRYGLLKNEYKNKAEEK